MWIFVIGNLGIPKARDFSEILFNLLAFSWIIATLDVEVILTGHRVRLRATTWTFQSRGDIQRNSELMESRCFAAPRPRAALSFNYIKGGKAVRWCTRQINYTAHRPSNTIFVVTANAIADYRVPRLRRDVTRSRRSASAAVTLLKYTIRNSQWDEIVSGILISATKERRRSRPGIPADVTSILQYWSGDIGKSISSSGLSQA